MSENDIIAEYVKREFPEILKTFSFASFRLRIACRNFADSCIEAIKKFDSSLAQAAEQAAHAADGLKIGLPIIDEIHTEEAYCKPENMNGIVYVKAIIQGENASGQKLVKLVAQNTDGIKPFYTDGKDLIVFGIDYGKSEN